MDTSLWPFMALAHLPEEFLSEEDTENTSVISLPMRSLLQDAMVRLVTEPR